LLFQSEAPSNGDGAAAGEIAEAELSDTEEAANVESHDDAPAEDAEATVEADKTEV
jgi:hypothetical protein